jgi:4-amino-4-deoxy-L-arabinose transferase-like glycosyltransferase
MPRIKPVSQGFRLSRDLVPSEAGGDRTALRIALLSIVAVTVAQIVFLFVGCDWELAADEAEYWAWSRRLDWSYYAKGPLIALVIRLGTTLFGDLSVALTGTLMPAVRLPAVLLGALTAWGVFRLAERTCGRRAGMFAVLLLPAIPLFRVGGILMTIDTPLICCWTWAALWCLRAVEDGRMHGWILAGLLSAVGVMAKYTMLAFPASVGLFLLVSPSHRRQLIRPGFWSMCILCGLGMLPIMAWNSAHGGAASAQMAERVGLLSRYNWGQFRTLLGFLAGEVAVSGVTWWFVGLVAFYRALGQVFKRPETVVTEDGRSVSRHPGPDRVGLLYLICLWGLLWTACVLVCLLGENEWNWSAPGFVSMLVLSGWWLDRGPFRRGLSLRGNRLAISLTGLWGLAMVGMTALQHTEWFYPALASVVPEPSKSMPAPMRALDPTCRMRGQRAIVPEVERRLTELRAKGEDPFILTATPYLASELTFYMPGHPEVYCLAFSYWPDRVVNQHDLWHPNPRFDLEAFRGRPAVVVGDGRMGVRSFASSMVKQGWFGSIESEDRLLVREHSQGIGAWDISIVRDYRGRPSPERWEQILLQGRTKPKP